MFRSPLGLMVVASVGVAACGSSSDAPAGPVLFVYPDGGFSYLNDPSSGRVTIGTHPAFTFTLEDLGTKPLTIDSVTLNTTDNAFQLEQPAPGALVDGGVVSKTVLNIHPDSAFATIFFSPTASKVYNATLTVTSNGGTQTLPLTLEGVFVDAGS